MPNEVVKRTFFVPLRFTVAAPRYRKTLLRKNASFSGVRPPRDFRVLD